MAGNGWSNQVVSVIIIVDGTGFTGLFFYSPTIGTGNLVGSWTANAGTDPFGNPYPAGFMIQTGNSRITINDVGGITTETYVTGNPTIVQSAFIQAAANGLGNAEVDQWLASSARNSTNGDSAGLALQSSNTAYTRQAQAVIFYEAGSQHNYLIVGAGGATIAAGSITAVEPGTGTGQSNVAVAETWHTASLDTGFTTSASDQVPRYRLEGTAGGVVRLDGTVYTSGAVAAGATMFTLPAGYRPAADRRRFVGVTSASGYTLGATLVNVATTGLVTIGPAAGGAGQQICLDGMTFPVD